MNDAKSYIAPFELNKPISSGVIAEVVESNHNDFEKEITFLDKKEYQKSDGQGLTKVDTTNVPQCYLGVLG
jgi:NADPH-dependent curcumin reductase CurA